MTDLPRDWPEWTRRAVVFFADAVHWGGHDLDEICRDLATVGIPNSVRSWPLPPLPVDHPLCRGGNSREWAQAHWNKTMIIARAGKITRAIRERVGHLRHETELACARIEKAAYQAGMAGWPKERLRAEVVRLAAGMFTEDEAAEIAIPAALRGKRSAAWTARRKTTA